MGKSSWEIGVFGWVFSVLFAGGESPFRYSLHAIQYRFINDLVMNNLVLLANSNIVQEHANFASVTFFIDR